MKSFLMYLGIVAVSWIVVFGLTVTAAVTAKWIENRQHTEVAKPHSILFLPAEQSERPICEYPMALVESEHAARHR